MARDGSGLRSATGDLDARGRHQAVRRLHRRRRPRPDDAPGGRSSPCSARPAAARRRRCGWWPAWSSRPRAGADRRPRLTGSRPYRAAGQHRLPELRAVPAPRRARERRVRAAPAPGRQGRRGSRSPRRSSSSSSATSPAASRRQLSGGQQQRVALARALVNRPAVLLLDEPLGALDLKLRRQMQVELKRIQTEVGLTFVHVTHDQEEAMTMADTVAVMNAGRIEQLGPPAELYDLPRTAFVANFLGQSNLLRGHGRAPTTATSWRSATRPARSSCPRPARPPARATSLIGVRPEKVRLVTRGRRRTQRRQRCSGPASSSTSRFTGVSTQYLVDVPGLGTLDGLRAEPRRRPRRPRPGDAGAARGRRDPSPTAVRRRCAAATSDLQRRASSARAVGCARSRRPAPPPARRRTSCSSRAWRGC